MKRGGIVRAVDELGRITIPKELRESLGWEPQTRVEFLVEGEEVRLRRYGRGCAFCGEELNLKSFRDKPVCSRCLRELKSLF